jgi:glutamine---fructose-6-phosphate transaminase (isomerizing)
MCGIFGIVSAGGCDIARDLKSLFLLSESRGKEAAGLALVDGGEITILKEPQAASRMMRRSSYCGLIGKLTSNRRARPITVIGHSRLVTNGLDAIASNNQPVLRESLIGIHNGIIVNDEKLWAAFGLRRTADIDTEALLALIEYFRRGGASLGEAAALAFRQIEGTASVAILAADDPRLILGTNNGSLHIFDGGEDGTFYFGSERHILRRFLMKKGFSEEAADAAIETIPGGLILLVDTVTRAVERVSFAAPIITAAQHAVPEAPAPRPRRIVNLADALDPRRVPMRRCTRCIMPETMPFISFDADGVCNYCRTYEPQRPRGLDELRELVAPYRRNDGRPDCLVAVSGGRDSCYGLHVIKRELGLNPVAYTYDWGVITDLARRNQARLCGKLGIEHILVSADIRRKREYVRRNVNAWLKKPSLGMIPLFMAGDKQYFYYADQTRRQLGVDLSFLCETRLERAHFKSGFMGINEGHARVYNIALWKKLVLLSYYAKEYLKNPRYLNSSLLDTVIAFYSSYFLDHPQIQLFDFAEWNEDELVGVLRSEYDWELAPDTTSTWRIGDGTAAFYNYIYWTVAGFTENDALRSNQIREGVIDRDTALALADKENEPRWESMRWYASTIGFSLNDALQIVNSMPRLYQFDRPAIDTMLEPAVAY